MQLMSCVSRFSAFIEETWGNASHFVRVRIFAVLLLVVVAAVLNAMSPLALKLIVDRVAGGHGATVVPLSSLVAIYVACQWFARTAGEARGLLYARAERRVFRAVSERLFTHLMHLPLRFHLQRQTGAITQTLDSGLEGIQLIMHHLVFTVLPVMVELGAEIVVLGRVVSVTFLGLFCTAIVCYSLVFCSSAGKIIRAGRAASEARVEVGAAITDGLLNFEIVKCFAAEELLQTRVCRELDRCEERWVFFYRQYAVTGVMVASIFVAFLAATIIVAAVQVHSGQMTIGTFVLVSTYMLQLAKPIEMLGFGIQGVGQGAAMLEKMRELFRECREPEGRGSSHVASGAGSVEFEEVSVAYRPERPVLKRVNFRIEAGRTLAVVGASGSGKSTMVRLLMRLLEPDSGMILFDDLPISAIPLSDLRRAIAVVPQDTLLLNDSLRNNIAFARPGATHEDIESAARIAHLHDFILGLPEGYETAVGERGVKLSGGERQRVAIARAVLKKPRMYIFDEATSSLDSRTEGEILAALRHISRSTTTLIIAHRLSTVVNADEIVVLEGGEVVEHGTHSGLLRRGGRYAALWSSQRGGLNCACER